MTQVQHNSITFSDSLSILATLCKLKFGGPRPLQISINADLYYDPLDRMCRVCVEGLKRLLTNSNKKIKVYMEAVHFMKTLAERHVSVLKFS